MNAVLVKMKLDTPLLLTGVGSGDENSARTLPYIPGAALRGLLVRLYAPNGKLDTVDAHAQRLFFSGAVRYLNAYPLVRAVRALPTPASWRMEKNADLKDKPEAQDHALTLNDLDSPERVGKTFCRFTDDGEPVEVFDPARVVNIHIGGEERGTVQKGKSTVFKYEALAAGQTLAALILADDARDLQDIRRLLEDQRQVTLGGSRSAGYGQVTLTVTDGPIEEAPLGEADDVVTLTLLSDALLFNADGQPTLNLSEALSALLNRPIEHQRAFVNPVRVGGFNRQWRLPLVQHNAVGMGSVFVYDVATFSEAELQRLAEHGLGERRVDGFGRLAINWPRREPLRLQEKLSADPTPFGKQLAAGSQALAREMAQRMLRANLDEQLRETVLNKLSIANPPSNHQLSRLRLAVRRALLTPDRSLADVKNHLKEGNLKQTARQQFERARVTLRGRSDSGSERLLTWLVERLDKEDSLMQIGGVQEQKVAGESSKIDDVLRREYTLRLIDGVLHQAMKEGRS
jgi:CRISPR-associated protein Csx10